MEEVRRPPELSISRRRADSAPARALIAELDAELAIHGLHPGDAELPGLIFLVAELDTVPVGCGALRPLEPEVAEVKRMFVRPGYRKRGIARAILDALEAGAREAGYRRVLLETGTRQPEALDLYRKAGYRDVPPFGEYRENPFSVCLGKDV